VTEFREHARFQLIVVALAGVAFGTVFVLTGDVLPSIAGFAILGVLGFQPWLRRGNRRSPIQDERDEAIRQKATARGYAALWVLLVAWGVAVPLAFSGAGSVPIEFVAPVVWVAWWVMLLVRSLTIMVLDSRGL
jgi:hypothetical protein